LTRLLADENIPRKTVDMLKTSHDIISVTEISPGLSDIDVIDLANRENRVIITFDKGFGELIFRERLRVKGLMLLRIQPSSPEYIAERIRHTLNQVTSVENVVITVREDRIRVAPLKHIS